jgi:antitoxin ParD1/3/4
MKSVLPPELESKRLAIARVHNRLVIGYWLGIFGRLMEMGMASDSDTAKDDEFTPEQQERIRAHIRARGMTFEVFLPESIADWLRELLAAGVFENAGQAAFIAFQEMQELDRHPKVRQQLLKAMIKASEDDPGEGISMEELRAKHQAQLREYANTELPKKSE